MTTVNRLEIGTQCQITTTLHPNLAITATLKPIGGASLQEVARAMRAHFETFPESGAVVVFATVFDRSNDDSIWTESNLVEQLVPAWLEAEGLPSARIDVRVIDMNPESYEPPDHLDTSCVRCGDACAHFVCCAAGVETVGSWGVHEEPICVHCCDCHGPFVVTELPALADIPAAVPTLLEARKEREAGDEALASDVRAVRAVMREESPDLIVRVVVHPREIEKRMREAYRVEKAFESHGVRVTIDVRVQRSA